jgi:hypothetical protein
MFYDYQLSGTVMFKKSQKIIPKKFCEYTPMGLNYEKCNCVMCASDVLS